MTYNPDETSDRITLYAPPFSSIKSYYEMIDIAEKYGIKSLETFNMFELENPNAKVAEELKKYADRKNVKIVCASVFLNLVDDKRKEAIEFGKKYLEIASILGSTYLHHTVAPYYKNPDEVMKKEDEYLKRGIEAVQELYDYSAKQGVRIIHEEQGFVFNGKSAFLKFFDQVKREIGVVVDFGNIMYADERIEDFIPAVADRIVHVHLKDFKLLPALKKASEDYDTKIYEYKEKYAETKGHNFLKKADLGEGTVDFERAFEELKKINYKGYFAIESPCTNPDAEIETFEKNLKFTNKCLNTML